MSGMNQTPTGERVHIAFFGKRNAGKSSLMNAVIDQELSVVSTQKGTTTDAVYKAMELLPLGPVVLIDTPGLDDAGELGEKRIRKTEQVMRKTDIAVLVTDAGEPLDEMENELLSRFEQKKIPCLLVRNKTDLMLQKDLPAQNKEELPMRDEVDFSTQDSAGSFQEISENEWDILWVSAKTGWNVNEFKKRIAALWPRVEDEKTLVGDLISEKDTVVLVVPLDAGAPKGRLILPQQQVIRGVLEAGAFSHVCRHTELEEALEKLVSPPKLVITDSQVFEQVNRIVPKSVPLTSFSILMARYKGDLSLLAEGASVIEKLKDGDKVLICEGCTHHRQCEDIGTVKLPGMIRRHTKAELGFSFTSGGEFPTDVSDYKMVVHCGGCMLNRREMMYRLSSCKEQGVPVTNYGVLIAYCNGILERTLESMRRLKCEDYTHQKQK